MAKKDQGQSLKPDLIEKNPAPPRSRAAVWTLPAVFLLLIFGFTAANMITPDRERSESENRALAQSPKFSLDALFSGKYTSAVETYITDQFIGRDGFIGIKTQADYLAGKRDSNNVYFGKDGYLFEVYTQDSVDSELLETNLDRIAELAKKQAELLGEDRVRVMLVPSASEILTDKLPPLAPVFDQKAAFSSLSKKLDKDMVIDLFPVLTEAEEQVFYKTDHHWTSYGAFLAYQAYCEQTGIEPLKQGNFIQEIVSNNFYGTLYTKARLFTTKPDFIQRWRRSSETKFSLDVNLGEKQYDSLYLDEFLKKRDQYSYFLGGNSPVLTIEREFSEGTGNGKTLLVLKDSFAHSLAPFLANEYDKVILLDLRYYNGSVSKFITEQGVTDLLISYHISTLESERGLAWLTK